MTSGNTNKTQADHLRSDAEQRLEFQHQYTLAGLKTLQLINGGAILALLTYAGNGGTADVSNFKVAFALYAAGLVLVTLAYLAAYASQGAYMSDSGIRAIEYDGMKAVSEKSADEYEAIGNNSVKASVGLVLASLASFIGGSYAAFLGIF
ncbi:hypothetical protein [Sphingomicrobium marinum]|uniref:hypothetical protein n=1 Tax=Sphingomicrobium marinum TaxID=1227950 RepID=UPI00223EE410|nr:hypothetical protein [Sphingomicrobium marinum]